MIYVGILFDTWARGEHYNASIVDRSRSRECPRQTIARDLVVIVLGASATIRQSGVNRMSDSLEDDRLGRLEKEVQRLSKVAGDARSSARTLLILLVGLAVLGGGALAVLHDQGSLRLEWLTGGVLKTVESKEFGFYNRDGTRVFLMDKDKFGYPNLILMDLKKNYRMGVKVWPEGEGTPGLVFYDSSGLRGHLRMTGDQASVLKLTGAKEKGSISLSVSAEGDPRLIMTDKSGKVMFAVPEGASEPKPPAPQRHGFGSGSNDLQRGLGG